MTDFTKTLIRCSALGNIMTNPKGKTPLEKYNDAVEELLVKQKEYNDMPNKELKSAKNKLERVNYYQGLVDQLFLSKDDVVLSDTCKSYLIQSYVLSKYGRIREVTTKQMIKGTISEEESIELFSILEKVPYNKNTERISNEYICGTPDLYNGTTLFDSTEIIDIKSSWDIFTFLNNVDEPYNDNYYWQLQGYMALTGAKIGTIAYCLVDTPDSLIEGDKYALLRKLDVVSEESPEFKKELKKLLANRKFGDIPLQDRLLTYSIERNDADIEKIYQKVEKCREYLFEFEEKHLCFSKNYRKKLNLVA